MNAIRLRGVILHGLLLAVLVLPGCAGGQSRAALERAQQLNTEVIQLYRQGRYADAVSRAREALALREQALGPTHPDVATSLNNLAELLRAQGDSPGARPLAKRALRIREAALGPTHPDVALSLNNLARLLTAQGDYTAARPLAERALRIRETVLGPTHPDVAVSLNTLALLLQAQGDYPGARSLHERALRIREAALGPTHRDVAISLNNLALLLQAQGDYAGARPLYERALQINEAALGPTHPDAAITLNNLALLLQAQGDYAGARPLYERALQINEAALGPTHPDVATSLNNLAWLLQAQADYARALPLYEQALRIREAVLEPTHSDVAVSLSNLAGLLWVQGDSAGAWPLYERALQINEAALGPTHPDVATSLNNLAWLLQKQGNAAGARPLHERALRIREAALGPTHPSVAQSLDNLAAVLWAQTNYAGARPLYERARRAHLAIGAANIDLDDEGLRGLLLSPADALHAYVGLLAAVVREPARDRTATTPASDAFLVAEQARGQAAQRALARAGARAAAGDAATASLARQVQELRDRRDATRKHLVAEYGRPAEHRDPARLGAIQQRAVTLERDLAAATERLRVAFPRYGELTAPEPIDAASARQLLTSDEALVSLFTLDDRILAWVLRPGRALVYRDIEVKRHDLEALVERVRTSLDQSLNADLGAGRLAPFDVAAAHALYRLLLEPVAGEIAGVKHLLMVPDDVLLPVPFGVLVTKAEGEAYRRLSELAEKRIAPGPTELAEYAKISWLAREHAIAVLPSATSLKALRQIARARGTEVEPFIGFGDPTLKGRGRGRGAAMVVARGSGVTDELRELAQLPGTRDELLAVARALDADPARALYLGPRATKPQVIALSTAGRLGRARVLSFATHGLLAGEMRGTRQPALVLTPPPTATEQDDGLLSLDDIVTLKLTNTDWVVLSACNTGAGDGSGEALSGLARAFFFAGAPTLLVSHWSVDDRATQALMTLVFERYAKDPSMSRAEALRQGMLALMAQARGAKAYLAHPFAWAPFSVVGEGR